MERKREGGGRNRGKNIENRVRGRRFFAAVVEGKSIGIMSLAPYCFL